MCFLFPRPFQPQTLDQTIRASSCPTRDPTLSTYLWSYAVALAMCLSTFIWRFGCVDLPWLLKLVEWSVKYSWAWLMNCPPPEPPSLMAYTGQLNVDTRSNVDGALPRPRFFFQPRFCGGGKPYSDTQNLWWNWRIPPNCGGKIELSHRQALFFFLWCGQTEESHPVCAGCNDMV